MMNTETKSQTKTYIPELDGLRAVAILAVLLFHMNIFPFLQGGFTGVDIFFVISGYVISRSLYNKTDGPFHKYLGGFYKRRMLRIVPALFTCLLITHFVSVLFIPSAWRSDLIHDTGLSAFFGFSNFALVFRNDGYFSPHAEFNVFLHTWSLGVEEQFYLFFPIVFFLWLKFRKRKNALGFISRILLLLLAIISLIISARESTMNHYPAFYLLHSRFWELAAGALVFQFQSGINRTQFPPFVSRFLFFTGLLLIIVGLAYSDPWSGFPIPWALFPVFGTVLMICGITGSAENSSLDMHLLNNPGMTYIGRISYSLYLWHWPVITLFRWTVGYHTIGLKLISLIVTVILAIFSYHFIETPVRRSEYLRKQTNWKILIPGLSVLLIGLILSLGMYDNRYTLSLSQTKVVEEWNSGWYSRDELDQPVLNCPELEGRQLFVMGDSHTAAYRTMLHILSSRLGIHVHEYEAGDCAIAGLLKPMEQRNIDHYEHSLKEIKELVQPGDIIFLASLRMPELSDRFEVMNITEILEQHFSRDAAKERQIALEEANKVIGELEQLGLTVLIAAPEPVLLIPPYRCSDWFNWNNPIAAPGHTISTTLLSEIRQPMMDSLDRLQELHPDLQVWDPFLVLCTEPNFSHYDKNGLPIFYDGDHLSAHGNRMLEPSFEEKILEIWKVELQEN